MTMILHCDGPGCTVTMKHDAPHIGLNVTKPPVTVNDDGESMAMLVGTNLADAAHRGPPSAFMPSAVIWPTARPALPPDGRSNRPRCSAIFSHPCHPFTVVDG